MMDMQTAWEAAGGVALIIGGSATLAYQYAKGKFMFDKIEVHDTAYAEGHAAGMDLFVNRAKAEGRSVIDRAYYQWGYSEGYRTGMADQIASDDADRPVPGKGLPLPDFTSGR